MALLLSQSGPHAGMALSVAPASFLTRIDSALFRVVRSRSVCADVAVPWIPLATMERTYPELIGPHARARLVVSAGEVGGRWSDETRSFLCQLARAKSRSEPSILRGRAEQAWRLRWTSTLACSAARAFAASLLNLRDGGGADGNVGGA